MILAAITTCRREPVMVERALKSVIAQTYTDWECVVVDDSPADYELRDDVRRMVEGYAQKDSRIRYVPHDRNRGVSAARNTALKIAGGGGGHEFIAYLDDDDEWLPEKLAKQLARFHECGKNTGLVYCKSFVVDEDTKNRLVTDYTSRKLEGSIYTELLKKNFVDIMAMLRTKYLAEAGGFDESMSALEDWEAWLRLARLCDFAFVNEPLGNIYVGIGRTHVNTNRLKMLSAHERITEKNKDFLLNEKYIYWKRLEIILKYYPVCGEYRKFFAVWLKAISLQPLRIFGNIWILIQSWIISPLKAYLKNNVTGLFLHLKRIKQKLKGAFVN